MFGFCCSNSTTIGLNPLSHNVPVKKCSNCIVTWALPGLVAAADVLAATAEALLAVPVAEAVVLLAVVVAGSETDVLAVVAWLALERVGVLAALEDAGATVAVVVAAPPQAARPRLVVPARAA